MKFKHVITTFALAGLLGVGALVGAKVNQTRETKADSETWYVVGDFDGVNRWNTTTGYAMTNTSGDVWVRENLSFKKGDQFKIWNGKENQWQGGWGYNNGETATEIKGNFSASANDSNIKCEVAGMYDVTFDKSTWHISVALSETTTYNVGFDENGDGTAEKTVQVASGETVSSYNPFIFGKTFGSWKLGDVAYDFSTPVTSDILLTATWTDREDEKGYVYVITGYGANWDTRYIYGYGANEGYGTWKGQLVTDIAEGVTQTLNFGGGNDQYLNGGLFKVPYYVADGMTNIILHNNGSEDDRSGNLPLGENYAYSFINNPWDTEGNKFDTATMASIGKAARFAFVFDKLLSGKDFCKALDSVQCAATYNAYLDAIDGDDIAKGWIESSCINTSNGGDNVNLKTILEELRKIAVRDGQKVNDSNSMNVVDQNNAILVAVIIVASIVSLSALFLLIKRRKQLD